jgi:membrane protein implicated in regulation of membrane protease activity
MGPFLAVGIIGFLFLALSGLLGHHDFGHGHDVGHGGHDGHAAGPSAFSLFCIAWTMMGFGAAGAFARYYGYQAPSSTGFGALAGLLLWLLAFQAMKLMYGQQGDSLVTSSQLIGKTGRLSMAISGGGMGKVTVQAAGAMELMVTSDRDLPAGTPVKIMSGSGSIYHVEATEVRQGTAS